MTTNISLGNWNAMAAELFPAHQHFIPMVAKALHDAVQAEQDRCAQIAESFWKEKDPENEKHKPSTIAYYISTNIRALRRPLRTRSHVRCPFTLTLVGVAFPCEGEIGHNGKCWNSPPGCGGDSRLTWTPTTQDLIAEIKLGGSKERQEP